MFVTIAIVLVHRTSSELTIAIMVAHQASAETRAPLPFRPCESLMMHSVHSAHSAHLAHSCVQWELYSGAPRMSAPLNNAIVVVHQSSD